MTERRRFSDSERVALYLAAGGRCQCPGCRACGVGGCGKALEPGWHADHVRPYSKAGPTDVTNGQAMCPDCNIAKGDTLSELRAWQDAALASLLRSNGDFLAVATPGAGKTKFALTAAQALIDLGGISKLVVVVPTTPLRGQWAKAAAREGIQLDYGFANGSGAVASDYDGVVVTYQAVASAPLLYRALSAQRTLVILDEIHHGGDNLAWGEALKIAFAEAARRLLLSGTPTRTDRAAVPFVHYDQRGMFVADHGHGFTYDYGTAIQDHAVRPIEFLALDGSVRWREAGAIVSTNLADADEDTLVNALRSALNPEGDWIRSVLRRADQELDRHRAEVPDAAGLVVAPDQDHARHYALMLKRITGTMPVLVITDEGNDAAERIADFARDDSRWIVAVQMVSEGVDIPRLAVGVYASRYRTELFFRQVVGRFVRMRSDQDETTATLLIPSMEPLLGYAQAIERTVDAALKQEEEKARRESADKGTQLPLMLDLVEPIDSSEAVHHSTILSGDTFGDDELRSARGYREAAGMSSSVPDSQVAKLLRLAGAGRVVGTVVLKPDAGDARRLTDEKATMRRLIKKKVNRLHHLSEQPYSHIHATLNKAFGGTVDTATLDELNKRLDALDRWIEEAAE